MTPPLPAPAVTPGVYDRDYYLEMCAGYEEWVGSDGERTAPRFPGYLKLAGVTAGETLVDVGTGRGELVVCAAQMGVRATGIEYSEAALALAEQTFAAGGRPSGATFALADARAMPVPDASADVVTMLDVIEHLTDSEQMATLAEVRRILRPGGRLLVHTMPNRLVYDVTYRLQRSLRASRRRDWPRNPRNSYELAMHVGEQTAGSMRRRLRASGLSQVRVHHGEMIYAGHVPEGAHVLYHRLAAHRLTRLWGRFDLWGYAVRADG